MENVRAGIIGSGFIADIHAAALAQAPGCEVVAVAAPNLHRVVDFAKRHDIPRALTNYRDLLKIDELDVVSLAIPNDLHAEVTLAAAEAGKHVICEKPLATSLDDADAMIAACEAAGVQLFYAEPLCFAPKYLRARELAQSGALGEIFLIKQSEEHSGPHSPWFWNIKRSGGGALMDMGVHGIVFARWLLGNSVVTHVTASMGTFVHGGKTEGEDHAITILNFEGGQMAVIESSWAKGGGVDDRLEIYGTKGHTRADLVFGNALPTWSTEGYADAAEKAGSTKGWSYPGFDDLWNGGYVQEMRYFVECVKRDEPSWLNGQVGRSALEVIYAAYRSAGIGATVRLPIRIPAGIRRPIDLWIGAGAS
jgi:predicted dehydrogenase